MSNVERQSREVSSEIVAKISLMNPRVDAMIADAELYSFQEYLGLATRQALKALSEGNYGIGAVYVYRQDGKEFVVGGRNGLISREDTHLHAEQDVIDAVESIARGEVFRGDNILLVRDAPHKNTERILVTSLEPCIMCVGRILTHRLNTVFIGTPDPIAGAMLDGREAGLPSLWQAMRKDQELQVIVPSEDDLQSPSYINPKYTKLPFEIFDSTREIIDSQMSRGGLADTSNLPLHALEIKKGK